MKPKNLIILFIFGLFLFLLPNVAEAACPICCVYNSSISNCGVYTVCGIGLSERLGTIGTVEDIGCSTEGFICMNCGDSSGKCKGDMFPTGNNGQSCAAIDSCQPFPWVCKPCIQTGVWDAYESQCVSCNGKLEQWVRGNTSNVYAGCAGFPSSCSNEGNAGDGKCESACGAAAACDEVAVGGSGSCGTGKTCDSNCQCVSVVNTPTVTTKDASSVETTSAYLNGYLNDDGGEKCYTSFEWWKYGGSKNYTSWIGFYYTGDFFSYSKSSLDKGQCYHFKARAKNSAGLNTNNPGEKKFLTKPDPPSGLSATAVSASQIDLSWTKGSGAYYTYIRRKIDSCPTSLTSGSYIDKVTGTSYSDTGLSSNTKYCYSLWSIGHDGDCSDKFSDDYVCKCATTLAGCTGTLDVSISGSGTCTVTASLTASNCDGKSWQVKDDGTTKCSGTVSGNSYSKTCSSWTVGEGSYTYNLYIGGVKKDSDSVTCSSAANNPPTCNYLSASPTSGNLPLNVSFTGSGSDSDGTIAQYEFDFGDGSAKVYSGTAGTTHTYNAVGTYCAKLRVKDNEGAWSTNTGNCPGGTCTTQVTVTEAGAAISPPGVATNAATGIAQTSAVLNGTLNDMGGAASCLVWFKWGPTTAMANSTPVQTKTSTGSFSANISGLTSGQTYYFEAFAKNGGSW